MFRRIGDFVEAYEALTRGSAPLFAALTDDILDQPVSPGHRTLGEIAWHIVVTIPEMMNRTGLALVSVDHRSSAPATAAEIVDGYAAATEELLDAVKANWHDDSLLAMDRMYGEAWPRGRTLAILMMHEAHHRGQMTVLLRQAGARMAKLPRDQGG